MVTNPTTEFIMLEPMSGYFESLRHTMVGLQQMSRNSSLLSTYLFSPGPHAPQGMQYLKETLKGEPVVPKTAKALDKSQRRAFTEATTREISIIQGPPGTGKTFTSNVILQSLVETQRQCHAARVYPGPKIPIIVVAQTNHALDQLLKKYMASPGSGKIVRLGGRSNDESIAEITLPKLMKGAIPGFRPLPVGGLFSSLNQMTKALREAHTLRNDTVNAKELWENGLLSSDQYYSITDDDWESNEDGEEESSTNDLVRWLGTPQNYLSNPSLTSQAGPRWQWRSLRTNLVPLPIQEQSNATNTYDQDLAVRLLANTRNLYGIRPEDRQLVYNHLQERLHARKHPVVSDLIKTYNELRKSIQNVKIANRVAFIEADEIEVVGCTATGLLKHRVLLSSLRPQILLIEEAAEIREGDTIAGLFLSVEHLILLGDHQQLQPHASLTELSRDPYRINISMFERLIKLGVPHHTLLQQRRMIPRLREIVQLFYPDLVDAPTIAKLPTKVPGVAEPLWWFQHDWPESPGFSDGNSVQNYAEARMVVLFVQYLVQCQNVKPDRITLLTYYRGQLDLLNRELANNPRLAALETDWAVRTVDGFQGEENDFILLSLVRGPNGKAGFLTQENRAIVGLSRARLGMYIFGHKDVLLKNELRRETWAKVVQGMKGNQGKSLPLCPDPETGEVVHVARPDQLKSLLRNTNSRKMIQSSESSGSSDVEIEPVEAQGQKRQATRLDTSPTKKTGWTQGKLGSWTANIPTLPERKKIGVAERLAAGLELISLHDSQVIPLTGQPWPWASMEMRPMVMAPVKEELLIEFSDEEEDCAVSSVNGAPGGNGSEEGPPEDDLLS